MPKLEKTWNSREHTTQCRGACLVHRLIQNFPMNMQPGWSCKNRGAHWSLNWTNSKTKYFKHPTKNFLYPTFARLDWVNASYKIACMNLFSHVWKNMRHVGMLILHGVLCNVRLDLQHLHASIYAKCWSFLRYFLVWRC